MAYSDTYQIVPKPNKTIACQDLLKDGSSVHSGWLRRQSLRNRLKIFSWPQVYVVISGGCVYCYRSEVASKPASAFSLYGYDRVYRAGEITAKEATWTFKLVHAHAEFRSYLFSSSSEKEMAYWMKLFKKEMLRANGKLPRSQGDGQSAVYQDADSAGSVTSRDYTEIEASIYEDSSKWILPQDYTNKKEEDASDEEMDRVVTTRPDLQERPPQPPPVPMRPDRTQGKNGSKAPSGSSSAPKATTKESGPRVDRKAKLDIRKRSDPEGSSIKKNTESTEAGEFWSSIFFYGNKEKASEIIQQIADEGVFLVRVNENKSMVLHVFISGQGRKFHIFHLNNKYTLKRDSDDHFDRVEDLIYFFYTHPLPRYDSCLSECYMYHPDYQTLQFS